MGWNYVFKLSRRCSLLILAAASVIILLLQLVSVGEKQVFSPVWSNVPEERRKPLTEYWMNNESNPLLTKGHNWSTTEVKVLRQQQLKILQELGGYSPHPSLGVGTWSDLVPQLGGTSVRILLVSSWRSGSSLTGRVIASHPATFYHFEPLLTHAGRIQSDRDAVKAITLLRELLLCNYTAAGVTDYVKRASTKRLMHQENWRLSWVRKVNKTLLSQASLLSSFCQLFPVNLAKVVRLPLEAAEPLLQDQSLSLKVVLLVRDPRATMESRHRQSWCVDDCANQGKHCAGLVTDYFAAVKLTERFPGRVRIVRYEDLQLARLESTRDLFEFLSLRFSQPVEEFLRKSKKSPPKGTKPSNATNSRDGSLRWRTKFSFNQETHRRRRSLLSKGRNSRSLVDKALTEPQLSLVVATRRKHQSD